MGVHLAALIIYMQCWTTYFTHTHCWTKGGKSFQKDCMHESSGPDSLLASYMYVHQKIAVLCTSLEA